MENFNQPLAEIYKAIHPINAKNKFVTYLNRSEKPLLQKHDLQTLKICVRKLKKLLDWKSRQILEIVSKADLNRIGTFFEEIKKDSRTMLILKKAICTGIIKKLKEQLPAEELQDSNIYISYKEYLREINWLFKSENRIVTFVVGSLQKVTTFREKQGLLVKLEPVIMQQAKGARLEANATTILSAWQDYYTFMLQRKTGPAAVISSDLEDLPDLGSAVEPAEPQLTGESTQLDTNGSLEPDEIPGHVDNVEDIFTTDQSGDEPSGLADEAVSLDLPDFDWRYVHRGTLLAHVGSTGSCNHLSQ